MVVHLELRMSRKSRDTVPFCLKFCISELKTNGAKNRRRILISCLGFYQTKAAGTTSARMREPVLPGGLATTPAPAYTPTGAATVSRGQILP